MKRASNRSKKEKSPVASSSSSPPKKTSKKEKSGLPIKPEDVTLDDLRQMDVKDLYRYLQDSLEVRRMLDNNREYFKNELPDEQFQNYVCEIDCREILGKPRKACEEECCDVFEQELRLGNLVAISIDDRIPRKTPPKPSKKTKAKQPQKGLFEKWEEDYLAGMILEDYSDVTFFSFVDAEGADLLKKAMGTIQYCSIYTKKLQFIHSMIIPEILDYFDEVEKLKFIGYDNTDRTKKIFYPSHVKEVELYICEVDRLQFFLDDMLANVPVIKGVVRANHATDILNLFPTVKNAIEMMRNFHIFQFISLDMAFAEYRQFERLVFDYDGFSFLLDTTVSLNPKSNIHRFILPKVVVGKETVKYYCHINVERCDPSGYVFSVFTAEYNRPNNHGWIFFTAQYIQYYAEFITFFLEKIPGVREESTTAIKDKILKTIQEKYFPNRA